MVYACIKFKSSKSTPSYQTCVHKVPYIKRDRQTDRQTDKQTDRQTDGRTDRRTSSTLYPIVFTGDKQIKPTKFGRYYQKVHLKVKQIRSNLSNAHLQVNRFNFSPGSRIYAYKFPIYRICSENICCACATGSCSIKNSKRYIYLSRAFFCAKHRVSRPIRSRVMEFIKVNKVISILK